MPSMKKLFKKSGDANNSNGNGNAFTPKKNKSSSFTLRSKKGSQTPPITPSPPNSPNGNNNNRNNRKNKNRNNNNNNNHHNINSYSEIQITSKTNPANQTNIHIQDIHNIPPSAFTTRRSTTTTSTRRSTYTNKSLTNVNTTNRNNRIANRNSHTTSNTTTNTSTSSSRDHNNHNNNAHLLSPNANYNPTTQQQSLFDYEENDDDDDYNSITSSISSIPSAPSSHNRNNSDGSGTTTATSNSNSHNNNNNTTNGTTFGYNNNNEYESSSIFSSILKSCGGPNSVSVVAEQYDYLTKVPSMMFEAQQKGGLDTIPEEQVTMWGMAPSDDEDDDEDGDDGDGEDDTYHNGGNGNGNQNDHQNDQFSGVEDIECVLGKGRDVMSAIGGGVSGAKKGRGYGVVGGSGGGSSNTGSSTGNTTTTGVANDNENGNGNTTDKNMLGWYCQPCADDDNNVNGNGNNNHNNIQQQTQNQGQSQKENQQQQQQQQQQRRQGKKNLKRNMSQKMSNLKLKRSIKKSNKDQLQQQQQQKPQSRSVAVVKNNKETKFAKLFLAKTKTHKNKNNKKSKIGGGWKCAIDEKTKQTYYYHTITREVSWIKPPNFYIWKVTKDPTTKRFYFYNVLTKETTWDKPKDFEEWRKVSVDHKKKNQKGNGNVNNNNNDRTEYYYNILTKETLWELPCNGCGGTVAAATTTTTTTTTTDNKANTNVPKKIKSSPTSVDVSSITREPSQEQEWLKQQQQQQQQKSVQRVQPTISNSGDATTIISRNVQQQNQQKHTKEEEYNTSRQGTRSNSDSGTGTGTGTGINSREEIDGVKPMASLFSPLMIGQISNNTPTLEQGKEENETLPPILLSKNKNDTINNDDNVNVNNNTVNEPGKIIRSTEHEKLRNLLFTYCPDEVENNNQLLSKSSDKENFIIKGLEGLIEETPFDELRLAIFSYVKETLKGMGEQPFDEQQKNRMSSRDVGINSGSGNEKKTMDSNPTIGERSRSTISTPSYSMSIKTSSTMTGISNSTLSVNNTTRGRNRSRDDSSLPYSMNANSKCNVSVSTQPVNNTSKAKNSRTIALKPAQDGAIIRTNSRNHLMVGGEHDLPDQRGLLVTTRTDGKGNGNASTSSFGDLTEPEEDDLTFGVRGMHAKDKIIVDLKAMETSDMVKIDSLKKEKRERKEELQLLERALQDNDDCHSDDFINIQAGIMKTHDRENTQEIDNLINLSDELLDAMDDTIESAYAADDDENSGEDYSYDDSALDDISALSDSMERPSHKNRRNKEEKEKKKTSTDKDKKLEKKKKDPIESATSTSFASGMSWDIDTSWNSVSEFISKVEKAIEKPKESTSVQNSIGYEELPRTKTQVQSAEDRKYSLDEFSQSSWDDDTLSSNFCSDNDNDYTKRIHGTTR